MRGFRLLRTMAFACLRQHSPGWVELASPRGNHGDVSWVVRGEFRRKSMLHGSACWLDTCPTEPGLASSSLLMDVVVWCDLRVVAISIGDVSWVGSTPRSPVPASLHL